ncbi:MAG: AAA family ATPase [Clostridiales bacterium]|nr:AAA family ATPase [Clostridiales bacterium]
MADKKDEIISMQLDLIRQMTENNIRRLSDDIWGPRRDSDKKNSGGTPKTPVQPRIPGTPPPTPSKPGSNDGAAGSNKDDDLTKASDGGDGGKPAEEDEDIPPVESMDDLKAELDSYIGLNEVKREVKNLINMATVYKLRRDHDLPTADMSLHMVFSGNPGTGKTMIARFMARVYHSLGLLSKGKLIEVDRSGLVAGYIGQTAIKTAKVCESALGSVLFIDEAYALTSRSENDFGFEAVDTLLKNMEDHRDDLVVIVAGYTELMEEFVNSNPGLRSRFNKYVSFADYTGEEMKGIFALNCKKACYVLDEDAEKEVGEYFDAVSEEPGEFGNARGVRNTFEKILTEQANRIAAMPEITREELMRITLADVKTAVYGEDAAEETDETDEADPDKTEETDAGSDEAENPADSPDNH